mgnify:CR=1 FL=1
MITLAERFIAAYNMIDKTIKREFRFNDHVPFTRMIDRVRKRHPVIEKYEQVLREYAQLRNAIVHERTEPHYIIAEPHEEVVNQIEQIRDLLINPEYLIPKFKRNVLTFQANDNLSLVLEAIRKHGYTQFPVFKHNEFIGLITDNGIARWLATHSMDRDTVAIDASLEEILTHEKYRENVLFMSAETNVLEAREQFLDYMEKKATHLNAILITHNGEKDEPLLGMITAMNLVELQA